MGITLTRSNLLSRAIRVATTGKELTRRLNVSPKLESNKEEGSGQQQGIARFFNALIPWGKRFLGFISAIFRGVGFSAGAIWGAAVRATTILTNFDWNASDNEIRALIRQNNISLASTWGATIGSGVGWVAGIAVGYGLTVLCPVIGSASLARLVAGKASLEALEEVGASTVNALRASLSTVGSNLLLGGYAKFRRFLGINPPDEAPSWTIAGQIEEKIDSIKNPLIKAFIEEFTDEFFDSFVESGFVFAYELDSQLAAARAAQQQEPDRTVRITPDKDVPQESIILSGSQSNLQTVIQTTLANHRFVYNRDMGQLVGQPAESWYRARPQRRQIVILFYDREIPPWRHLNGKRCKEATYTIPDAKPGLDWSTIKRAAKAFNWGRFRCTANLDNGRQMAVYGATAEDAEDKLRDLLSLSTADILTTSTTEERIRNPKIKKEPTRMYPAYVTMLVRRASVDRTGRTDLSGNTWEEDHTRVALWTNKEPSNFKEARF